MSAHPAPAERLLETAAALFPREGIRAVGIDRLLAEAGVARASLYQGFGSKDGLVVAYLRREDAADRAALRRAVARQAPGSDRVLVPFDLAARSTRTRQVFGCRYLNAAAEYPEADHPVRAIVLEHRTWLCGCWHDALADAGVTDAGPLVERLQLVYDGGLAGSQVLRDAEPIRRARALAAEAVTARVG